MLTAPCRMDSRKPRQHPRPARFGNRRNPARQRIHRRNRRILRPDQRRRKQHYVRPFGEKPRREARHRHRQPLKLRRFARRQQNRHRRLPTSSPSARYSPIRRGDIVAVHPIRRGTAEAIEVVAHGDKTSAIIGRRISGIKWYEGCHIAAVVRANRRNHYGTPYRNRHPRR